MANNCCKDGNMYPEESSLKNQWNTDVNIPNESLHTFIHMLKSLVQLLCAIREQRYMCMCVSVCMRQCETVCVGYRV